MGGQATDTQGRKPCRRLNRRDFLKGGLVALAGVTTLRCARTTGGGGEGTLSWGAPGRRDGQFQHPRAIAAHRDEIYVVDKSGRIQVFTPQGKFKRLWSTPDYHNGTPTGLDFDGDDTVVVPDTHYSRILRYSLDGRLLEQWGKYGKEPGQFIYPTDVAMGADGTYYICEYGGLDSERVDVFDSEKKPVRRWGKLGEAEGEFNRPMGIELTSRGELLVADTGNHRIQCFDTQGKLIRAFAGPGTAPGCIKFPYQIALAPDETLLVCEYGNHRISRFKTDGTFVGCYGGPGRSLGSFDSPRGVAAAGEWVYVADTNNHRVQRFPLEALA